MKKSKQKVKRKPLVMLRTRGVHSNKVKTNGPQWSASILPIT